MSGKRSYTDACGIARALDVLGERWALMVVRELMLGPKRFTDIRAGLPGVSPDVLAQRLRGLEEAGVISRRELPPPAASTVYELTPRGHAIEPVLIELGRWGGANAPPPPEGQGMSLDSHIVSMQTLFDPALAGEMSLRVQLHVDFHPFFAIVDNGEIEVGRGELGEHDALIACDAAVLLALIHRHSTLAAELEAGSVVIEGRKREIERFLRLFPLPEPAPVA